MSIPHEEKRMVAVLMNPSEGGMFNNGLHQNGYFLYRLLQKIPNVQPFLSAPDSFIPKENHDVDNLLQCFGVPVVPMSFFREKYRCDVMICASFAVEPQDALPYKEKGTKFVAPIWGHKYVMNTETAVFGRMVPKEKDPNKNFAAQGLLRRNPGILDALWISPHFTWTKQYIASTYNMPLGKTFTAPYIWDSELADIGMKAEPKFKTGEFTPYYRVGDATNKNIYTLEPNINVVKTGLVPFTIANHLHKESPDHFNHCYMFGGKMWEHNPHMIDLINNSSFSNGAGGTNNISFEYRTKLPAVFTMAKVQLAHHWNLGLNYTYLEAAHYHHPIVHNSEFMKDMGYYYRGAAVIDAASQLSMALRHEERQDLDEYNAHCDEVVHRFSINNEQNIRGYSTLIENLFTGESPRLPDYIEDLESDLAYGGGYFSPSHLPSSYLL
jgi:hypothetical protein